MYGCSEETRSVRKVGDDGGSLREMVGEKKQRGASDGEQSRAECV